MFSTRAYERVLKCWRRFCIILKTETGGLDMRFWLEYLTSQLVVLALVADIE